MLFCSKTEMCSYEARKDIFMIKSHSCMTVASSTDASFLSCSLAEASPIKIKKTLALSFSTYMWLEQCVRF